MRRYMNINIITFYTVIETLLCTAHYHFIHSSPSPLWGEGKWQVLVFLVRSKVLATLQSQCLFPQDQAYPSSNKSFRAISVLIFFHSLTFSWECIQLHPSLVTCKSSKVKPVVDTFRAHTQGYQTRIFSQKYATFIFPCQRLWSLYQLVLYLSWLVPPSLTPHTSRSLPPSTLVISP